MISKSGLTGSNCVHISLTCWLSCLKITLAHSLMLIGSRILTGRQASTRNQKHSIGRLIAKKKRRRHWEISFEFESPFELLDNHSTVSLSLSLIKTLTTWLWQLLPWMKNGFRIRLWIWHFCFLHILFVRQSYGRFWLCVCV